MQSLVPHQQGQRLTSSSPQPLLQLQSSISGLNLTRTLKQLSNRRGGIKNAEAANVFLQVAKRENELKGRILLVARVKLTTNKLQRLLVIKGILVVLESWLVEAIEAKKLEFAKVVLGLLGELPILSEDVGMKNLMEQLQQFVGFSSVGGEVVRLIKKWSAVLGTLLHGGGEDDRQNGKMTVGVRHERDHNQLLQVNKRRKLIQSNEDGTYNGNKDLMDIGDKLVQPNDAIAISPLESVSMNIPGFDVTTVLQKHTQDKLVEEQPSNHQVWLTTLEVPTNIPLSQKQSEIRVEQHDGHDSGHEEREVINEIRKKPKKLQWVSNDVLMSVRYFRSTDPAQAVYANPLPQREGNPLMHEHFVQNALREHQQEFHAQQMYQDMLRQLHQMRSSIEYYEPSKIDLLIDFAKWDVQLGVESTEVDNPVLAVKPKISYDIVDDIPDTPSSPIIEQEQEGCIQRIPTMQIPLIPFNEIVVVKTICDQLVEQSLNFNGILQNMILTKQGPNMTTSASIFNTQLASMPLSCQEFTSSQSSQATMQDLNQYMIQDNQVVLMIKPCFDHYELIGANIPLQPGYEKLGDVVIDDKKQPIYLKSLESLISPILYNLC